MRAVLPCLLVFVLALATAASAGAHGTAAATGMSERELRAYETATLGTEHAAEHAVERRASRRAERRWRRMSPAQQVALRRRLRRADVRATAALDAARDQVGAWDPTTIPLPTFAINAVLMPTGKIAFWGRPPLLGGERENRSQFYVWDPVTGAMVRKDAPEMTVQDNHGQPITVPAPLFCSGQSLLADGQLFIAGGTLATPQSGLDFKGLKATFTFDPWTLTWRRQPDMDRGRWYPTQVELPDGRIAIFAGNDESGQAIHNPEGEIFTPAATRGGEGEIERKDAASLNTGLYPHVFVIRGGKLVVGGPEIGDSYLFDLANLDGPFSWDNWGDVPAINYERTGGNAILWPQGAADDQRVTLLGGFDRATGDATATTETLDASDTDAGWAVDGAGIPAMNLSRSYGNVVQLPDSSLVAVGGGAGDHGAEALNFTDGDERRKQVELLRPGTDPDWRLGPPQRKWRAYHSTAMLLPDGRVLSAGDDYWYLDQTARPEGGDPMDVAEIYSPPYLYDGDQLAPRPAIDSAPAAVPYGAPFGVAVSGRTPGRAVLVAPAATTHGNDMNQRVVNLQTVRTAPGQGLDVRSPAGPDVAPPGYYMLFVLDDTGTPSVARWVRVGADAPAPELLPPAPTASPTPAPPAPTPIPTPTPKPRDRTPPSATISVRRVGHRIALRVRLSEAGRGTLEASVAGRRVRRTLTFTARTRTRTITLRPPSRATRLTVTLRASDAAGNLRSVSKRLRIPRR